MTTETQTKPTKPRKAPEDRKPAKSAGFAFTDHDGAWHVLPYASSLLETMPFGAILDLLKGGQSDNETYRQIAGVLLAQIPDDNDGIIAMRTLPLREGMSLFARWFQAPDDKGVTAGELFGSSV